MEKDTKKILSEEETIYYFKLLKQGDKQAFDKLIESNMRFVTYICKQYQTDYVEYEDLFQIGSIGLIKAVKTFDVEKGNRFATYAYQVIGNEIKMALRKTKKIDKNISLDASIHESDKTGEKIVLERVLASDNDVEEECVKKEFVRNILNILKEKDRFILECYFGFRGQDFTQKEIANLLDMEQSNVSRKISHALKEIRLYLNMCEGLKIKGTGKSNGAYTKTPKIKK